MGNSVFCFCIPCREQPKTAVPRQPSKSLRQRKNQKPGSLENGNDDDETGLKRQAMAAAMLFKEYQRSYGGSGSTAASLMMMNRSNSVVYPSQQPKRTGFVRSSSSQQHSGSDTVVQPQEFVNSKSMERLETKHFVLVHGGGFGAWCWYKTMTLLEEAGFKVDAVDLTGSGFHSFGTNSVANLAQYVKPLTELLHRLDHGNKVILVGHDFGGACISYAMELYPSRISKAVFVAATMLADGQSTLDLFSRQMSPDDLMHKAQMFLYANGPIKEQRTNVLMFFDHNKELIKVLFFNQSPSKDVALASLSMRPMPFALVMEKLCLSKANYGSVRRFYVLVQEDRAMSASLQETMINSNVPERVFRVKGSDHSPFFSRPQALHKDTCRDCTNSTQVKDLKGVHHVQ